MASCLLETSMLSPLHDNLEVTLDNGRMSGRADSGSLTDCLEDSHTQTSASILVTEKVMHYQDLDIYFSCPDNTS